ncbi:MAG: hypothetical protein HRT54_20730 [Colwellia sp.]|nr:hypothetical protein [Colwellia sp.]
MKLINKLFSANAVLFLTLLVPSQHYAFANEQQNLLVAIDKKEKVITKVKLAAKNSSQELEKMGTKAVLTALLVRKNIPTLKIKSTQKNTYQLNDLIVKKTSAIKTEILPL